MDWIIGCLEGVEAEVVWGCDDPAFDNGRPAEEVCVLELEGTGENELE